MRNQLHVVNSDLPQNQLSDSSLIRKLQDCTQDERQEILLILYERYKNILLKLCFYYLKDYDKAADLFHEVFVRIIQNAGKLKNPNAFKSWMLMIARNLCIDHLRKNRLINYFQAPTAITVIRNDWIEDLCIAEIQKEKIFICLSKCIQNLDESLLAILKLRREGLRTSEILKIICVDRAHLRRSYRKIKKILESHMKKNGFDISIEEIIRLGDPYKAS